MILILDEKQQLDIKKSWLYKGNYKISFDRVSNVSKTTSNSLQRIASIPGIRVYSTFKEQELSQVPTSNITLEVGTVNQQLLLENKELVKSNTIYKDRIKSLEQTIILIQKQAVLKNVDINSFFNLQSVNIAEDKSKVSIFKKLIEENLEIRK